jgi:hypothetical protein
MIGLCPGTSLVSMVSGRMDAWVAFAGIFIGILVFTLPVDWAPGLSSLNQAGSGEVSLLPGSLGVPPLVLLLLLVLGATAAFFGAEKIEGAFRSRRAPAELTPRHRPQFKMVLGGGLAVAVMLAMAFTGPRPELQPMQMASLAPLRRQPCRRGRPRRRRRGGASRAQSGRLRQESSPSGQADQPGSSLLLRRGGSSPPRLPP